MLIAGFWRRLAALLIDIILLFLFGLLLGNLLADVFVQIGMWGRLIGFLVAGLYFALLNSKLFDGQTVGKRIFKIKVIDKNGQCISILKSLLRYSILGMPYFLNNAQFSEDYFKEPVLLLSFEACTICALVIGVGLSVVYLYLFNRHTRQSLHDLVIGTYVVNINTTDINIKQIWKGHYIVIAFIFIAIIFIFFKENPLDRVSQYEIEFFSNIHKTKEKINKLPNVIKTNLTSSRKLSLLSNYINVYCLIKEKNINYEEFAHEVAKIIIDTYSEIDEGDEITVLIGYEYDIGIYSYSWSQSYSYRYYKNDLTRYDNFK